MIVSSSAVEAILNLPSTALTLASSTFLLSNFSSITCTSTKASDAFTHKAEKAPTQAHTAADVYSTGYCSLGDYSVTTTELFHWALRPGLVCGSSAHYLKGFKLLATVHGLFPVRVLLTAASLAAITCTRTQVDLTDARYGSRIRKAQRKVSIERTCLSVFRARVSASARVMDLL
jgi:hypothetical protein